MKKLKIGVIGVGNMGSYHAKNLYEQKVDGAWLYALCDNDEIVANQLRQDYPDIKVYGDYLDLLSSGCDAVIIATPHYFHPEIAIAAFERGVDVLSEKPTGVYTKQVRTMNDSAKAHGRKFAVMFNQRTSTLFSTARQIVKSGELGELKRAVWIITNWYRTQSYYDSCSWRGTYKNEGGGVLINQAPHNLDILQWILGMPKSVYANLDFGRYHSISVEDSADLLLKYENGMSVTFLTSTGEPCGTNRFEIVGSKGKIVLEGGLLKKWISKEDERDYCFCAKELNYQPEFEYSEIAEEGPKDAHLAVLQNFVNHILFDEPLVANGQEGICELKLSNAAYLSAWTNSEVSLPLDEDKFYELLKSRSNDKKEAKTSRKNYTNPARWQINW